MTQINPEIEVINITPSMVIEESSQKRVCKLINVKDKSNFKCNDILNKSIGIFLNKFVDVYKSLEETKMLMTEKHLALVAEMHTNNQTVQLWLHARYTSQRTI